MYRMFKIFLIVTLFLITNAQSKEYKIEYAETITCNYKTQVKKYCTDEDESVYKPGIAVLNVGEDSLVSLSYENHEYIQFHYDTFKVITHNNGDEIAVFIGLNKKSERIQMAIGPDYLSFYKEKKVGRIFIQGGEKSKYDFGKRIYNVASTSYCEYDDESKRYEKKCVYRNLRKKNPFEIATKMRGKSLYLVSNLFGVITVLDAMTSKDPENKEHQIYYGFDDEGEDVEVTLGEDFFIIRDVDGQVVFDEILLPEDVVTHNSILGSGVAVSKDIIVTNAHVTEGMDSLYIYRDGIKIKVDSARIIGEVPQDFFDFAVIKVYGAKLDACPIATKEPELGAEVLVYGYPMADIQGVALKVNKGIVSGKNGLFDDTRNFQMDAAIQHGNSGGPIVSKGKIVGLATASMVGGENVNVGIKANKMLHMLRFFDVEPKSNTNDFSKCTYLLYGED